MNYLVLGINCYICHWKKKEKEKKEEETEMRKEKKSNRDICVKEKWGTWEGKECTLEDRA